VPFGFVTSEGSPEMRERAASAGARFLIAKPFTAETFRDNLQLVIG
jgi:two-component system chemotaxis response regulator CheY